MKTPFHKTAVLRNSVIDHINLSKNYLLRAQGSNNGVVVSADRTTLQGFAVQGCAILQ
ncbi:hypothetical protein WAK64_10895 [Bacillus spongiae]|uniref:Uncharacterized protein n=1 Tax=Bacillus spongiae TaxID=2683610 RepID=A0ABU8HDX5_9BACI